MGVESRNGLTEGLREFIQVDIHRTMEVEHMSEGLGTFKVRAERIGRIPRGDCQGEPR